MDDLFFLRIKDTESGIIIFKPNTNLNHEIKFGSLTLFAFYEKFTLKFGSLQKTNSLQKKVCSLVGLVNIF